MEREAPRLLTRHASDERRQGLIPVDPLSRVRGSIGATAEEAYREHRAIWEAIAAHGRGGGGAARARLH